MLLLSVLPLVQYRRLGLLRSPQSHLKMYLQWRKYRSLDPSHIWRRLLCLRLADIWYFVKTVVMVLIFILIWNLQLYLKYFVWAGQCIQTRVLSIPKPALPFICSRKIVNVVSVSEWKLLTDIVALVMYSSCIYT